MPSYPKPALLDRIGASHCAIEASAGTGKTYTLEHLVVELILSGVPLEKILVVTFTRKATLELMTRVREKLSELAELRADLGGDPHWDLGPAQQELLRAALLGFDRATIATIHGFCQQVLKDASFEGGQLFQQEAVAADEAFDRAFTTLLRRDYATRGAGLLEVGLRTLGGLEGVRALLKEALKEADCLDLPVLSDARSFLEGFPVTAARAFLAKDPAIRAGFTASPAAIHSRIAETLARLEKVLAPGARPEDFWLDGKGLDDLQKYMGAIRVPGLTGEAARLSKALAEVANFPAILVAVFLPPLRAELRRSKQEEGLYDFDDMIALVAEALSGPGGPALAGRLRERFQVALIDEFQDTDRQQWEIFSRIFLDSDQGHRLFLVGDPKQAIYGFRSGDLPTYGAALERIHAATGAAPLQLDANYRSTPAMVSACNDLLRDTGGVPFFTGANARHYQTEVTCGREKLGFLDGAGAPLPAIRAVDVPAGLAREVKLRSAAGLARALKESLEQGRLPGGGRIDGRLRPEDVFVLTRTLKEGKVMARALREVGIRSVLYRQDGLFAGAEAAAVRDLLLAIEAPFDGSRRARALLGPFFGLSFAEAENARDLPEGHPILNQLFRWRELALRGRFGELCNGLIADSGMSQRLLFLEEGQRTLTNLAHILELLQREAVGGHCGLADLAVQVQRWIDGQDRPSVEDSDTQRLERQGGAVLILTMHKAKGLEAPLVVLYGGTSPGGGLARVRRYHRDIDEARRAWVGSPKVAPLEVQGWIQREEEEEAQRLAYVALTRAQAQLLVARYHPGDKPPAGNSLFDDAGSPKAGPYRAINQRLQTLMGPLGEPLEHPHIRRVTAPADNPVPAVSPAPWAVGLPPAPAQPDFPALARRSRPNWVFSYSGLQKGLERHAAGDGVQDEIKEYAPAAGPGGGKEFGTQVHACLQKVDLRSFQGQTLDSWLQLPATAALAEACLLPASGFEALRWVHQALTLPLALPSGGVQVLSEARELLREMDFMTPYPGRGDFLAGSIDLLFLAEGRAHVLDWKTNRLPGYGPEHVEASVREHYLLQVKIYALTACRFLGIADRDHYERAFGGVVYVFLRGLPEGGVWTLRPSWEELGEWERELDALQPERLIPAQAGGDRHV